MEFPITELLDDLRTFLRPFKGVNKRFLSGYIAMAEVHRNLKRISPKQVNRWHK